MPRTIVVDDHRATRTMLEHVLRAEGMPPMLASSGAEALAMTKDATPHIWFVDWMMPEMSGLELIKHIRAMKGGDRAYVIIITAKDSDEDLATAFESGADDFITKPINALELHARLQAACRIVTVNSTLAQKLGEIQRLNNDLEVMASTDAMTGLLNRHAGCSRLSEAHAIALRFGRPLSIALADIDSFRRINETFGHDRGDAAIRFVAHTFREIAGPTDFVSRIGGEEFLFVLPECGQQDAQLVLERCRTRISRAQCVHGGKEMSLTISAGCATLDAHMPTPTDLMNAADTALQAAKNAGRNRVAHFQKHPAVVAA